jgi:hypothetical protein
MTNPARTPAQQPIDVAAIEREARRLRAEAIATMWKSVWARLARRGRPGQPTAASQAS